MAWVAINASFCVLMLLCAASAPQSERRLALEQAVVLTCGWMLYASAWGPEYGFTSPAQLIANMSGQKLDPVEIWAATDCAIGLWLFHRLWAHLHLWMTALFGLILAQVYLHALHLDGRIEYSPYNTALDVLWWGQVAVFVFLGGRHALARVARAADRVRARADRKALR